MRVAALVACGLLVLAQAAPDSQDEQAASADPSPSCHLVGLHIQTDDLNGAQVVCDGRPAGTVSIEPASAAPDAAPPTQYFPLDE